MILGREQRSRERHKRRGALGSGHGTADGLSDRLVCVSQ